MSKTLLAATVGEKTVFRASTRTYAFGGFGPFGVMFSDKPRLGLLPTRVVDRTEYARLVKLKNERCARTGRSNTDPGQSWIDNADLA